MEENVLFPKALNWLQHLVYCLFFATLGLKIDTFLMLMGTRLICFVKSTK